MHCQHWHSIEMKVMQK